MELSGALSNYVTQAEKVGLSKGDHVVIGGGLRRVYGGSAGSTIILFHPISRAPERLPSKTFFKGLEEGFVVIERIIGDQRWMSKVPFPTP